MKSILIRLFIILILPLAFSACLDDGIDIPDISGNQPITIEAYLDSFNINATQDPSGLYYVVHEAGTGSSPSLSNSITVKYTGKLTNGVQFDSSNGNNVTFQLNNLIEGWQIGFQLINIGTKATFYIPPNLGYGTRGIPGTVIGPNAGLIFDVELVDFQ
ncbi:MAG: FKBP-type peptidyl-prolyl cis-trans isomerase [Flammeovirgaceae bacterium]